MPQKKSRTASQRSQQKGKNNPGTSQLRVISGKWRSRKIEFQPWNGLRPTPDRVRETLFNWLSFHTEGSHCLDLFAGTGILGIEALSRGAKSATFIDSSSESFSQLQKTQQTLMDEEDISIKKEDVMSFLKLNRTGNTYNLVFADPPFRQGFVDPMIELLETGNWLSEQALIYIEFEEELDVGQIPSSWQEIKRKKAGQVISVLFQRS